MGLLQSIVGGATTGGVSSVADLLKDALDKFGPEDPTKKAEAQLAIMKLEQDGHLAELDATVRMAQMQADVNKAEAASSSVFVAGWRPWCGWICGTGFGMIFVVGPLLEWTANLFGHAIKFPILDTGTLTTLLMAMLGMAGLRSYDKKQQTDSGH